MFYNNQQHHHQSSSYYYAQVDHQQSFGYNNGNDAYGYNCRGANNEFYDNNNCYWNNNNNNSSNNNYIYYESKVERPPSSTTSSSSVSSSSSFSLSSLAPTASFAQENSSSLTKKVGTKRARAKSNASKNSSSKSGDKKLKIETGGATSSHDSSLISPACSAESGDDLIFETLYNAYITGSLSKSRYKRLIANERERKRMHGLNAAFENLRSVLPSLGSNKQFSKYETLQMAKSYIAALREILVKDSESSSYQPIKSHLNDHQNHSDFSTPYSNNIVKLENNNNYF